MEQSNGEAHKDRSRPSLAEVFRPVATAPTEAPAGSLDPSGIGKLVEHEVAALLQAAEAEAGRIRSKALAGVRMAESKVAALEQQVHSTLAELAELAGRIEAPVAPSEGLRAGIEPTRAGIEPTRAGIEPPRAGIEPTRAGIEPPVPADDRREAAPLSVFDPALREPVAPNIPPSDEVVRLLREHLT
jgi:hypothetical protein